MAGFLFLCALCGLAAFACGRVCLRAADAYRFLWPVAERTSYGGVLRRCPQSGGTVLAVAGAGALLPLALIGVVPAPLLLLFGLPLAARFAIARKLSRISQHTMRGTLLLFVLCVPNPAFVPVAVAVLLAPVFLAQIDAADLVPGIPGALYGPALACSGALLVVQFNCMIGCAGVAAAGAFMAVHASHCFPPRLTLGPGGAALLAALNLAMAIGLALHGAWFAVLLLWCLPLTEGILAFWQALRSQAFPAFENARKCGEPEAGLTLAAGGMSIANVILACTVEDEAAPLQIAALALACFLAWQFTRFLRRPTRIVTATSARGEPV